MGVLVCWYRETCFAMTLHTSRLLCASLVSYITNCKGYRVHARGKKRLKSPQEHTASREPPSSTPVCCLRPSSQRQVPGASRATQHTPHTQVYTGIAYTAALEERALTISKLTSMDTHTDDPSTFSKVPPGISVAEFKLWICVCVFLNKF